MGMIFKSATEQFKYSFWLFVNKILVVSDEHQNMLYIISECKINSADDRSTRGNMHPDLC